MNVEDKKEDKENQLEEKDDDIEITRIFIPMVPLSSCENSAIKAHLNECKRREILLQYKDGRFGRNSRWRYFALNSQMR